MTQFRTLVDVMVTSDPVIILFIAVVGLVLISNLLATIASIILDIRITFDGDV